VSEPGDELARLSREVAAFTAEFTARIERLEARIAALGGSAPSGGDDTAPPAELEMRPAASAPVEVIPSAVATPLVGTAAAGAVSADGARESSTAPEEGAAPASGDGSSFGWGQLLELLGPIGHSAGQLIELFGRYRDEGKAPALIMSLAGSAALVLGLGYLLQYSFNEVLGPWAKISVAAVFASAVTAAGTYVSLRKDGMQEYGASVIALGLSLLYVTVYFAGPYYLLVGPVGELAAIALITVGAYALALTFETRLTATLTLVGGTLAPLVTTGGAPDPVVYGGLLTLLAVAGVHLSQRVRSRGLMHATFALTTGSLEYIVWSGSGQSLVLLVYAHAIFYLFSAAIVLDGWRVRESLTRVEAVVLCANLAFLVVTAAALIDDGRILAVLMAANAAPFAVASRSHPVRASPLAAVFILIAGVLAAVALFAALGAPSLAVFWALEGALLIHLGLRFDYRSVRFEGMLLLAIALANSAWLVVDWSPTASSGFAPPWFALAGSFAFLSIAVWLIERGRVSETERRLATALTEAQSLWFAVLFMITVLISASDLLFVAAPVPMGLLLYRSAQRKLQLTEVLALAHAIPLLVEVVSGAEATGSFRFSAQPLLAQIARVELFALLWLIPWWYRRYFGSALFAPAAPWLREAFFLLLPLLLLPTALRRAPEWFLCVPWLSCLIVWEVQRRVPDLRLIRLEHRVLAVGASAGGLGSALAGYQGAAWGGYTAMFIGLGYFAAVLWRERGLFAGADPAYRSIFAGGLLYAGAVVGAVGFAVSGSAATGLALAALYFFAILGSFQRPLLPVRGRLRLLYLPGGLLTVAAAAVALVGNGSRPASALVLCIAAAAAFQVVQLRNLAVFRAARMRSARAVYHALCQCATIAVYLNAVDWVGLDPSGAATSVLLVLHATSMLFLTLQPRHRRLLWISITLYGLSTVKVLGFDMADFNLPEKVVAFMAIGGVLLVGAYRYQAARNRLTERSEARG
jgi:hypothetical protein